MSRDPLGDMLSMGSFLRVPSVILQFNNLTWQVYQETTRDTLSTCRSKPMADVSGFERVHHGERWGIIHARILRRMGNLPSWSVLCGFLYVCLVA